MYITSVPVCHLTFSLFVFLFLCSFHFSVIFTTFQMYLFSSFVFSHLFASFSHVSSPPLSSEFCVKSTTVEFVLLPLIRLVLIFLPPSCSSAERMDFFNCLSEGHLHCSSQQLRGLLPAIYYEIKINGCWNLILWAAVIETNDDFLLNRIWNVSLSGMLF